MTNESEKNSGARTLTRRESDVPQFHAGARISSPFALLREMTDWMDQAFEGDFPIMRGERVWAPAVEVREQDSKLVVSADLPGIEQQDVKVEVDNNTLVIQGAQARAKRGTRRISPLGTFLRLVLSGDPAAGERQGGQRQGRFQERRAGGDGAARSGACPPAADSHRAGVRAGSAAGIAGIADTAEVVQYDCGRPPVERGHAPIDELASYRG